MSGLEVELKAGLSTSDMRLAARRLKSLTGLSPRPEVLRATYYDRADGVLALNGIALRVRREGGRYVQMVKSGRSVVGSFSSVREEDAIVPSMRPSVALVADHELREAIEGLLQGQRLQPVFETRVRRRTWQVPGTDGLVEVALDEGKIRASGTEEQVSEAEFELLAGQPEAVFNLAGTLLADMPVRLDLPSKGARGAALAGGVLASTGPVSSKPPIPDTGEPAARSFARALHVLAPAVAANLHLTRTTTEPEGPHQLRVALRRLRAATRAFHRLLDPHLANELEEGARNLGRLVAPMRDFDVLAEVIGAGANTGTALTAALQHHGVTLRQNVLAELSTSAASAFAIRLLALAAVGGWSRDAGVEKPVDTLIGKVLDKGWNRALALGDRLAALDDEDRHALRKRLKTLRYQIELVPALPSRKAFLSALKRMQVDLGTLNDLAVLESWSPDLGDAVWVEALAERKQDLLANARHRSDLAMGRACRHWQRVRALERPWPTQPKKRNR